MSTALDKSLDDIISSQKKARPAKKVVAKKSKPGISKNISKKATPKSNKKPVVSFKKPAAPAPAATTLDASYATKVVVHGLPKDIKLDAIKDFFQSQVGGVQNIALTYNERGQFKGIATIIFKAAKSASLAVSKYNGAPIDGGSSKLKLELIIDPTKKPLTSRIAPIVQQVAKAKAVQAKKQHVNQKGAKAKKPVAGAKAAGAKKPVKKPVKQAKKTVEQLDQEMADYFG